MLQVLKKLIIVTLISLCVANNTMAADYLKIKDNITGARIYQKGQNATFIPKSFLRNKHDKVFVRVAKESNATVCDRDDIVLIDKIGWVCAKIFESVNNVPNGYIVYGQTKEKPDKNVQIAQASRYGSLRKLVESSKPQFVEPDKVVFVVLSKNYTNNIVCSGKLQKIIYNKEHSVELEHDKHNIFVKAPHNKLSQFLSDMLIKCDGSIYQLNAAFDAALPSQKIILKNPNRKKQLESYKNEIDKFVTGMNYEVRVAELLKLAYLKKYPPFWIVENKFLESDSYTYIRKIDTGVENLVIYEFVIPGDESSIIATAKKFIQQTKDRYVALGIVKDNDNSRVFIVAKMEG